LDYSQQLDLKYIISHSRTNYTHPNLVQSTIHELSQNITYSGLNWIITTNYTVNYLHPTQLNTIVPYDFDYKYKFDNNSRLIPEMLETEWNINLTNTHAMLLSDIDKSIGENSTFRLESPFLIAGPYYNDYEAELIYQGNITLSISNNNYLVRHYNGTANQLSVCTA
jgi:hypothetical protein